MTALDYQRGGMFGSRRARLQTIVGTTQTGAVDLRRDLLEPLLARLRVVPLLRARRRKIEHRVEHAHIAALRQACDLILRYAVIEQQFLEAGPGQPWPIRAVRKLGAVDRVADEVGV